MSTTEAIVDRVVAQMQAITNIGVVHDRMRLALRGKKAYELFTAEIGGERALRAWLVHLGRLETKQADSGSRQQWDRTLLIEGFLEFDDDGSETSTIALAESVIRALWVDAQATRLNSTILLAHPPAIEASEPRYFAGVVCSYVRLAMPVQTLEAFST